MPNDHVFQTLTELQPSRQLENDDLKLRLKNVQEWQAFVQQEDLYWKHVWDQTYERHLNLTNPVLLAINHLRQALRFYVIPFLQELTNQPEEEQALALKYLSCFHSPEYFWQMLDHFYHINREFQGQRMVSVRDPYLQEAFILFDLFKAKKTLEAVEVLLKEVRAKSFQSYLEPSAAESLLIGFKGALLMCFKQSLKPEFQRKILESITPQLFRVEAVEERREHGLLMAIPEDREGSHWRRVFLHLLFKRLMRSSFHGKAVQLHYDLVGFERLRRSYLVHWLEQLNGHEAKQKIYADFLWQGKPFAAWLLEDPLQETSLLEAMPLEPFEELAGKVQRSLPPEKRSGIEPQSSKVGVLAEAQHQFQELLYRMASKLTQPHKHHAPMNLLQALAAKATSWPESHWPRTDHLNQNLASEAPFSGTLQPEVAQALANLKQSLREAHAKAHSLLPGYMKLLRVLIQQSFHAAGHDSQMAKELLTFSRCRLVDGLERLDPMRLKSIEQPHWKLFQEPWERWEARCRAYLAGKSLFAHHEEGIEAFLRHSEHQSYHLVMVVDFLASRPGYLRCYLRIQYFPERGVTQLPVGVLHFNLFDALDFHLPFRQQIENIHAHLGEGAFNSAWLEPAQLEELRLAWLESRDLEESWQRRFLTGKAETYYPHDS